MPTHRWFRLLYSDVVYKTFWSKWLLRSSEALWLHARYIPGNSCQFPIDDSHFTDRSIQALPLCLCLFGIFLNFNEKVQPWLCTTMACTVRYVCIVCRGWKSFLRVLCIGPKFVFVWCHHVHCCPTNPWIQTACNSMRETPASSNLVGVLGNSLLNELSLIPISTILFPGAYLFYPAFAKTWDETYNHFIAIDLGQMHMNHIDITWRNFLFLLMIGYPKIFKTTNDVY